MTTITYEVKGMTCSHCGHAVTTELSARHGVAGVEVDLDTGRVTVTSAAPLDTEAVRAAIDHAGYQLVG